MDNTGYIPISRKLFDNPLWNEKREFSKAEAWIDLLQRARFATGTGKQIIKGKIVTWERGQLIASIRFLKEAWGWKSNSKVETFLKMLENETMIRTDNDQGIGRITICKYDTYNPLKDAERTPNRTQKGQTKDAERTDKGQTKDETNKGNKEKNEEEREEKEIFEKIISRLNQKAGTNYRPTTKSTQQAIRGRMSDGFTLADFFTVIDKKCLEWKGTEMEKHLTPETLLRPSHFEKYLNQKITPKTETHIPQAKLKGLPKYGWNK